MPVENPVDIIAGYPQQQIGPIVQFIENDAGDGGGGMSGGGTFVDVLFLRNSYAHHVGGGGLAVWFTTETTLTDVQFVDNVSWRNGGGLLGTATLTNVTFDSNKAARGGGMYDPRGGSVLTNVRFIDNVAVYEGGAAVHVGFESREESWRERD